jgi:hypothetical protein
LQSRWRAQKLAFFFASVPVGSNYPDKSGIQTGGAPMWYGYVIEALYIAIGTVLAVAMLAMVIF